MIRRPGGTDEFLGRGGAPLRADASYGTSAVQQTRKSQQRSARHANFQRPRQPEDAVFDFTVLPMLEVDIHGQAGGVQFGLLLFANGYIHCISKVALCLLLVERKTDGHNRVQCGRGAIRAADRSDAVHRRNAVGGAAAGARVRTAQAVVDHAWVGSGPGDDLLEVFGEGPGQALRVGGSTG